MQELSQDSLFLTDAVDCFVVPPDPPHQIPDLILGTMLQRNFDITALMFDPAHSDVWVVKLDLFNPPNAAIVFATCSIHVEGTNMVSHILVSTKALRVQSFG